MDSNTDDEYEPWPDCYLGETGAKPRSHYRDYYYLKVEFTSKFGLDAEKEYTYAEMEKAIIRYAKDHTTVQGHNIHYNAALWDFLGIPSTEKVLKYYRLEKYLARWTSKRAETPTAVLFGRPYVR